ncbi:MAG: signal recognition particle protein, partial [Deltaproteobacteria bacterium]
TLIERAQAAVEEEKARRLEEKLRRDEFDLEDFREQLRQLRRMGPLEELLKLIPGVQGLKGLRGLQMDERQLVRMEAIINSMTKEERRRPQIINGSRRLRIARGSGTSVQEVNRLLKQFQMARKMIKGLRRGRGRALMGMLQ